MGRLVSAPVEDTGRTRKPGWLQPPLWRSLGPMTLEAGYEGSGWDFIVPTSYEFDLSSPWWARALLPRRHLIPMSAFHDYARHEAKLPIEFSNWLAWDVMCASGVWWLPRVLVFLAIHLSDQRD